MSSHTFKFSAALNPTSDHRKGIIKITIGIFTREINKIPKVNIIVGQGAPKVGDCGYICPKTFPKIG
jgi:hypothetical protein